jgi:hypothetical protein
VNNAALVHANGRSKIVDESEVMGIVTQVKTIKPIRLLRAIKQLLA